MKLVMWTLAWVVCLFAFSSKAEPVALSLYEFTSTSEILLGKVSAKYEIVKRTNNTFEVIVPQVERKAFLSLFPKARLIENDIQVGRTD